MTMNIEIYESTLTKNICTVAYCLQDEQGTADVPIYHIHTKNLIKFINDNELLDYDDRSVVSPYDYLQENTFEVVKSFLMEGLK